MSDTAPGPIAGTTLTPEYVRTVGRFAYVWGWPMVSMINRRVGLTSVPEPGLRGGVLPNAPVGRVCMMTDYIAPTQRFIACTNQDVLYGFGFGSLDEQPAVFQLPDFGDRFWVAAAWDHRTDSFARLGKQYGSPAGFYAVVGPNWEGDIPDGITEVFRSPTALAAFCPRIFVADTPEDRVAVRELLSKVDIYPLSEFDGTVKEVDWAAVPSFPAGDVTPGEVRWVDPETFFDQLPEVLDTVPPLEGEEALYDQFRFLLDAATASPDLKHLLTEIAHDAEDELISPLLQWEYNGPDAGNGWHSPTNNAGWGTDYFLRTAVARSNMFVNAARETRYFYNDDTSDGEKLDGRGGDFTVTFAAGELPPVDGFFSVTLYNEHHFYYENDLGRYSLGTKNPDLVYGDDGSLTLYVGNTRPADAPESNWLPAPAAEFSLFLRAYWPRPEILDGEWTPPRVQRS